jgi:hydroxysqualene synthase
MLPDPIESRPNAWSLDEAFEYCEAVARAHYENFPVGSRLVPRQLRPYVWSVYAFARQADDFADEAAHAGRRLEKLAGWEARLDRCLDGRPDHPVFVALGETIRRFELPDRLFRDLLDAFRQDCRVSRYENWDRLLDYSRRSAEPVGRLVLLLFGHRDEELARYSDAICSGLQLTNFWQDVALDLAKNRIYLPAEDRRRWGVKEEDLAAGRVHDGMRALMQEMVDRTRRHFAPGRPLLRRVGGRLGLELRWVWFGGHRILRRIERAQGDVFRRRPVLSRADHVWLGLRAALRLGTRG